MIRCVRSGVKLEFGFAASSSPPLVHLTEHNTPHCARMYGELYRRPRLVAVHKNRCAARGGLVVVVRDYMIISSLPAFYLRAPVFIRSRFVHNTRTGAGGKVRMTPS